MVAYSAKAVAYHEDRVTLGDFIEQKIWHGRGLARMITRYGRQYLNRAAEQVDNSVGASKLNFRYLPYLFVSWSFTAVGVALESLKLACDPDLREQLRTIKGVTQATSQSAKSIIKSINRTFSRASDSTRGIGHQTNVEEHRTLDRCCSNLVSGQAASACPLAAISQCLCPHHQHRRHLGVGHGLLDRRRALLST